MSALDDMSVVWNTHAVLPVVGVSVCQLVEFAIRLVRDIEHALVMREHLIFLESYSS